MTDARIPERYLMDRRIVRLTDTQRSSYFMAILWSVSNRTDGRFDSADLPLIPTFTTTVVDALVGCGLWAVADGGWIDTEFKNVQTSKDDLEVLDNARRADREKKARLKAHKAGNHELCTPATCNEGQFPSFSTVPGDVPGERSRGAHRRGEERRGKGQEGFQEQHVDPATGVVDDWYTAPIPGTADPVCDMHKTPWPCEFKTSDCEWSYPA